MYRIFFYCRDDNFTDLFITHEEEFKTFNEVMQRVVSFEDGDLFEIAKDVPCFDDDLNCSVTCLRIIARPASMRAYVNSYYSRW